MFFVSYDYGSTKMIGICSSPFLFEVQLLVSCPCLDLLLKNIADWLRLVSQVDITQVEQDEMGTTLVEKKLFSQVVLAVAVLKGYAQNGFCRFSYN